MRSTFTELKRRRLRSKVRAMWMDGLVDAKIAAAVGISCSTVRKWRMTFKHASPVADVLCLAHSRTFGDERIFGPLVKTFCAAGCYRQTTRR